MLPCMESQKCAQVDFVATRLLVLGKDDVDVENGLQTWMYREGYI